MAAKKDNNTKKAAFIKAYQKAFGNISEACKAAHITRQTYYNWFKSDLEFKEAIKTIEPEEQFLDFLESQAVERIKNGSDSVLIFALKSKGKKRGWIEKQIVQNEQIEKTEEVDYSKLTNEELRQLIELKRKLIEGNKEG